MLTRKNLRQLPRHFRYLAMLSRDRRESHLIIWELPLLHWPPLSGRLMVLPNLSPTGTLIYQNSSFFRDDSMTKQFQKKQCSGTWKNENTNFHQENDPERSRVEIWSKCFSLQVAHLLWCPGKDASRLATTHSSQMYIVNLFSKQIVSH